MNLHMPQDPEAESELRNLAAIPYQIISPANNAPIIGIFQDSMLGSYQFTRKDVSFTPKDAMILRDIENPKLAQWYLVSTLEKNKRDSEERSARLQEQNAAVQIDSMKAAKEEEFKKKMQCNLEI